MRNLGTSILLTVAALILLVLLSGGAVAQSAPAASNAPPTDVPASSQASDGANSADQPVTTIRVPTNEVNVVFTVTDKHGKRITDLKQADFQVVDDNKPPAEIHSFRAE